MNDPTIIKWLESDAGESWRKKNFRMIALLDLRIKEDCAGESCRDCCDSSVVSAQYW